MWFAPLKWPDTTPQKPNEVNQYSFHNKPYIKKEVTPGHWQYVIDQAILDDENAMNQRWYDEAVAKENHRAKLWEALNTRLLTEDELKEAIHQGRQLNIDAPPCHMTTDHNFCFGSSYNENEKAEDLRNAFLFQYKLQWEHERLTK